MSGYDPSAAGTRPSLILDCGARAVAARAFRARVRTPPNGHANPLKAPIARRAMPFGS
jgi:hypothetical protein